MPVAKEQIRQIIADNNLSSVAGVYSLLRDSFKDILQELMEAELDASLGYEKNQKGDSLSSNKRNGHSQKTLKSQYGEFQIDVPRDRNGEFEPKLIPKYQRDISGIEDKVISLYSRGLSTRDIHDQLQDLYGIELSAEMVSKITDRILPEIKEWQSRPLNPIYPFVFMDCIHYKVREEGRILSRAAYVVLGVTTEGYKEILSITVGANETSKFWLGMLNDLKNRGVQDVLFFCVDGLPGFKDAIQAVYPQAQIQRCVIHMLRNSFKYVNYNDLKKFSSDFKAVYNAPTEAAALAELEAVKEKWGKKYPYAVSNWENNPPDHVYHKHHRRAEPPVPEGNKNKECIPERQRTGENAVSGERKCDKEMDAEIPELGPGAQPADSSVSGTSYTVSVKEEKAIKAGTAFYRHKQLFRLCYTDIYSIAGKARFKPEVREMVLASVNV